ncbi:MAG: glycosyltransferase family 2 protein [Defluviitaleaceae bacterium]|nr:glycosyltransferase family 2 protein [Defluviitaleaceae bacterium]
MLLSIGMIVKNEEKKYLFECLNSIQPILEEVDSELIIFDTGSTDDTIEIARGYTSEVYEIEWRDDFSWARNHTLEKATGEWFMYVDADEIFTDVSDIISFFNGGEYKKFKSASYRWRNVITDTTFNYSRPIRLFKMEKDIRFVGRIHEAIQHKQPLKYLESIADHYGYYSQGLQGQKNSAQKHERNVKLLLQTHNENPKDARTIHALANTYLAAGDKIKFKEYLDLGMEVTNSDVNNIMYHVFTDLLVTYYNEVNDNGNLIKTAEEYIKHNKINQCILPVYYYYTLGLISAGRKKEAAESAFKTLEYFDLNKQGKLDSEVGLYTVFPSELTDNRAECVKMLAVTNALCHEFEAAFKWVAEYENETGERIDTLIIDAYVGHCIENKDAAGLPLLYGFALKYGAGSEMYDNIISILEKHISAEAKPHVAEAMVNEPSLTKEEDDYMRLQRLRATGNTTEYKSHLDYFLKTNKPFNNFYSDVIFFAMKWNKDFSGFIENVFISDSAKFIESIFLTNHGFADILLRFFETENRFNKNQAIKSARIISSLCMHTFMKISGNNNADNVRKVALHELAMRSGHRYLSMVYKPDVYCESEIVSVSETEAYIFFAGEAFICKDSGDILGYVRGLRKALQFNPGMNRIIQLCMESLQY